MLLGVLKRRYLNCLEQRGLNVDCPEFESLRKFVLRELNVMTSDYAQTFFKVDEKEKSRGRGETRGSVCVRLIAVKTDDFPSSLTNAQKSKTRNDLPRGRKKKRREQSLLCYVFSVTTSQDIFSETAKRLKTFLTIAS